MNHRPLWISNFTEPSSRIFNRSDWQDSSWVTLARLMISKTLSGFSRSALRIFSRSLMTPDSIFLLTDFPLLRLVHTWRKANLRMRSFNPLLSYDIAKYHAPVALLVIPCPAPTNCGDR